MYTDRLGKERDIYYSYPIVMEYIALILIYEQIYYII